MKNGLLNSGTSAAFIRTASSFSSGVSGKSSRMQLCFKRYSVLFTGVWGKSRLSSPDCLISIRTEEKQQTTGGGAEISVSGGECDTNRIQPPSAYG